MFHKLQFHRCAGALLALLAATPLALGAGLSEHRVMIPERGEVIGYMISVDTNHYAFLPPPGWRVSCKPGSRAVVMITADLTTSITVDFIDSENPAAPAQTDGLLSSRYPDARVRESFPSFSGLGEVMAFDIERKAAHSVKLASRVIYAAQPWGAVEFTLTAPAAKFAEWTTTFANTVNSFHRPAH